MARCKRSQSLRRGFLASLRIPSGAVSTSGDYQRFFWYEQDGKRHRAHHIIDPATLHPGERCRSVTVVCSSAADADLFSTALFLLDQKTGEMLAERENLAVLWVLPDGGMLLRDPTVFPGGSCAAAY